MAIYDYECPNCFEQQEVRHKISEEPKLFCAACSSIFKKYYMKKVHLSAPGIDTYFPGSTRCPANENWD